MIKRGFIRSVVGLVHCSNNYALSLNYNYNRKYCQIIKGEQDDNNDDLMKWNKDIGYPFFCLDPYAERNFVYKDNKYSNKAFIDYDRKLFEDKINELYHDQSNGIELKEGYAPFCKHLFVPNFVGDQLKSQIVEITSKNEKYLKCDYIKRREEELPVLIRWFDTKVYNKELQQLIETAKYLDIILYSRKQIIKENDAMKVRNEQKSPWGIISIKPQMIDYEIPMEPSTMMRNALPLNEGGSGVSLDHSKYEQSVKFWRKNARLQ